MRRELASERVSPGLCVLQAIMGHGENGLSMRDDSGQHYKYVERWCCIAENLPGTVYNSMTTLPL